MNSGLVLNIIIAVLGALIAATANLNDLFGPNVAKLVVSGCGLALTVLSSVAAAIQKSTSNQVQTLSDPVNQVKAVARLPGVTEIVTNQNATVGIQKLAADPKEDKIS